MSSHAVIYNSDIVDAVLYRIEGRQLGEITNAIEQKIANLAQANVQMVYAQMNRINDEFENLQNNIAALFTGVEQDDIKKLVNAISNGNIDEGKIVQAFASQNKKGKHCKDA